jgi:dolichol-phosphate mannosyltransferase
MFLAWRSGQKLVAARRATRQDGFVTDRVSRLAWKLLRRFAVKNIPDGGFDFFLMDKEIRDFYITQPEQIIFMQGRLLFYGYPPYFIDYERRKRPVGRSHTGVGRRLKYFIDGFAAYSYLPLRFMSACGILLCLASMATGVGITWYVLIHGRRVEGWTSLMVALLFLSGVQMLFLGILGEYLWRGLEEIRRRPHYIIQQSVFRQGYDQVATRR